MPDGSRIEELRRRVEADPASIAFAALAEELRRSGMYEDAINVCRTSLQRHPSYLSARVTLGRSLLETGNYDEARQELEIVLKAAPENLAAIRAMAEIHERTQPADTGVHAVAGPPTPSNVLEWALPKPAAQPLRPIPVLEPELPADPALPRLEALLSSIQSARASLPSVR